MATLKKRLHKKNASGTYDTIHLETSASCVLMNDGTTIENTISSLKTSVSTAQSTANSASTVANSRVRGASGSYKGNATETLTIPIGFRPKFLVITSIGLHYFTEQSMLIWSGQTTDAVNMGNFSPTRKYTVTDTAITLSLTASDPYNGYGSALVYNYSSSITYYWVAFTW